MKKYLFIGFTLMAVISMCQNVRIQTDWANMKRYSAENKKLGLPAQNENRIVFMGNSITEFWKIIDSSFFEGNSYVNRGISGQTTPQMLIRFRQDVIDLKPKVVVILAGINDIAENTGPTTIEDIYGNIVSMAELASANGIKTIISSVLPANNFPWRPDIKPAEKVIELNSLLEKYCVENGIVYLDYYSSMVDSQKGLDEKYTDDGVHPTLAGYQIMEPLLENEIIKILEMR
ncbi:MAG: acylhydrolase [Bacteroidetes bacterium GWF2_38_335]|nr:MAG: acylhydrolase [Bacteroidetes bacterium GWF2_38_335]HBS88219.1 acylhydrolase [Bacteroidales bacterium]